jgi:hypothetical protein
MHVSKEWIHCCCCERLLMNLENEIRLKMLAHFIKEKKLKTKIEKEALKQHEFFVSFFLEVLINDFIKSCHCDLSDKIILSIKRTDNKNAI